MGQGDMRNLPELLYQLPTNLAKWHSLDTSESLTETRCPGKGLEHMDTRAGT